jgi:glycosyltransferase involved in cell wall biosynthesis
MSGPIESFSFGAGRRRGAANAEKLAQLSGSGTSSRPIVAGKFLSLNGRKLPIYGVTYGPFEGENGFPSRSIVERDLADIAENGMTAVRTYTTPPKWFLDTAMSNGLHVMVGLPWEQHTTFLSDSKRCRDIERGVAAEVRSCESHPAILAYAIGNEIPAAIVRWHGHRPVERFLRRLYEAAKTEDPTGLVTYVNFPSTEYLYLPFLDFLAYNVYLETPTAMRGYLARLQTVAGNRPLMLAEVGIDSLRNGEAEQAESVQWQIQTALTGGCAGAFVFSWTDEWFRGEVDITDWQFGLTNRFRSPKRALPAAQTAFAAGAFKAGVQWPRISVVVCSRNGARTLRWCLEGVRRLQYPNFELIVVDDGSADGTPTIAKDFGAHLICTSNQGLSAARNKGLAAATGEIIAYLDDDARPDEHWLSHLANTFMTTSHAGVGGPNIPPINANDVAGCVAHAPGGPIHVLLTDDQAEHIPGCNMAFRRESLMAIDGFDTQFRIAGDDVDVCWRISEQGSTLGFNPAAMVWHQRRNTVYGYLKQQFNYGRAEADLERKWPEKYNSIGHLTWRGRLYGLDWSHSIRRRIYHGTWGSELFQRDQGTGPSLLGILVTLPEWYLVMLLAVLVTLGGVVNYHLAMVGVPALVLSMGWPVIHSLRAASRAELSAAERNAGRPFKRRSLIALFHLSQPLARLLGRMLSGLTPWRRRASNGLALPKTRTFTLWCQKWKSPNWHLRNLESALRTKGAVVRRGGAYDRWDLEVRMGLLGGIFMDAVIEEHGKGTQVVRYRAWPHCKLKGLAMIGVLTVIGVANLASHWTYMAVLCGAAVTLLVGLIVHECAAAMGAAVRVMAENPFSDSIADDRVNQPGDGTSGLVPAGEKELLGLPGSINAFVD